MNTGLGEMLFYGGLALMGCSAVAAAAALAGFRISGKRLAAQLEKEYGKRKRK